MLEALENGWFSATATFLVESGIIIRKRQLSKTLFEMPLSVCRMRMKKSYKKALRLKNVSQHTGLNSLTSGIQFSDSFTANGDEVIPVHTFLESTIESRFHAPSLKSCRNAA